MLCRILIIATLSILFTKPGLAQFAMAPERAAWNNISKHRWERARNKLQKSLRKDSVNITAQYVFSIYYLTPSNPEFQVDSAYRYALRAMRHWNLANGKERERMKRFPVDSVILMHLRQRIDSAAFEQAKHINTEKAYVSFLLNYAYAMQRERAEELRDEVAFLDALKENSYPAFFNYLNKYPASARADEARRKYEKLLFEFKTKDKRLKSYEDFLREQPTTPYRNEVERQIFEIRTAAGRPDSLYTFLQEYPESAYASKAKDILYYLREDDAELTETFWTDSLRRIHALNKNFIVPYMHDGKIGFMDKDGQSVIAPVATEIDNNYRCGNIVEDIVVLDDQLIARDESVIFHGHVDEMDEIGAGFLKVQMQGCTHVIHKKGFRISDCVEDARVLNNRVVAIRQNGQWGIFSLSGRALVPFGWDEITTIDDVLIFRRGTKYRLITVTDLARVADQQKLKLSDELDAVKPWPNHQLEVRSGEYRGVLDQSLEARIMLDKHTVQPAFEGGVSTSSLGFSFFSSRGEQSAYFKNMRQNDWWIIVKKDRWQLFDTQRLQPKGPAFDSISFVGPFAMGLNMDSVCVYFSEQHFLKLPKSAQIEFMPGGDSTSYLIVGEGDKKAIYNYHGQKLFSVTCDQLQYAGAGTFIMARREKKGLVDAGGKPLLPIEFDAIGSVTDGVISVLKNMKFGLYNLSLHTLIKPQYDKNLKQYNALYVTAYKNGKYGFLGGDNKPVSQFEFDEIHFWNDTTALVKKEMQWNLYDIRKKKIVQDKIKNYKLIKDRPGERIAVIQDENAYGVISSIRGIILTTVFSDIINLGSADEPVYFTEKQVEEAGIFVIIYYDENGKLLRKQVCEADDYERIYCTGH